MKCSACQSEMTAEHLFGGGDSIRWVSEEQPVWKKCLSIGKNLTDFLGKLLGFHCDRCGFLVVPHDKLKGQQ
jgi:hypothetical protein